MYRNNTYLEQILQKYNTKIIFNYSSDIFNLKSILKTWAGMFYIDILESGSYAKGTAISLSSDIDYMISLTNSCNPYNGGLKAIYESLYNLLAKNYLNVRKQNVSVRIVLNGLEVDITPARKQIGNTNDHSLWLSKQNSWQQTNIKKHIIDISKSGRINEIKLLKIWRELHQLEFPSIYLEYLVINTLLYKPLASKPDILENNFKEILFALANDIINPLSFKIVDPANSNNILSELLTTSEKNKIIYQAKLALNQQYWQTIVW